MWKLYFKVLPDQYESTLFFNNEELEQLKGSSLYGKLKRKNMNLLNLEILIAIFAETAIEERKSVEEKFKFLNEKLFEVSHFEL